MAKKLTALLMVLLLLCTMLAGCAKTTTDATNPPADTTDTSDTADTPAADTTDEPADTTDEPDAPAVEQPIGVSGLPTSPDPSNPAVTAEPLVLPLATDDPLITFWQRWEDPDYPNGYDEDTMIPSQIYDATGVQISIHCVSNLAATEQFNLMLVAGAEYDIINEVEQFYTKGAQHMVDQELCIDLTDYVAKYMPNYQAMRAYSDTHTRGTATDSGTLGWIYGLSYEPEVDYEGMGIRSDLLEELNLELPETVADWTEALGAIHETWGGFMSLPANGLFNNSEFASAYGIGSNWYVVDGEVRYGVVQPEFKDYLAQMRDWYAAGLIDPQFAAGTEARAGSRTEVVAMSYLWGLGGHNIYLWGMAEEDETEDLFFHGVQHAVLNEGDVPGRVCMKASVVREAAAITPYASDPVLCCKLLDYFFSEEGSILLNYGPIGVTCELDENGKVIMTEAYDAEVAENIASGKMASGIAWEKTFNKYAWFHFVFGIFYPERLLLQYDDLSAYETNCLYWTDHNSGEWNYPQLATMNEEETEEYSRIYADAQTMIDEMCPKIITGMVGVDEGYEELMSMLESIEFSKCIEYKQNAVNRYYAR